MLSKPASFYVTIFNTSVFKNMLSKENLLLAVVAVAALSAGVWLASKQMENDALLEKQKKAQELEQAKKNYSPVQGAVISPPRKIIVPNLMKDDGSVFNQDDLKGQWHFLFFGYMNCPDICPVTMGVVSQAKKAAEAVNHMFPQVVFVSVDPARDKVEMLTDYVQYFDKDFIGVTGEKELIKALTLQLSVVYLPPEATENINNNYKVDHSSALLLLNPEGRLVAFFNPPHDADTILKDFQTIVNLTN